MRVGSRQRIVRLGVRLVMAWLSLGLLLLLPAAQVAEARVQKVRARVSFYLVSLGKPDTTAGTYNADFYVTVRCTPACPPDLKLQALNQNPGDRGGFTAPTDPEDPPDAPQKHTLLFRGTMALTTPMDFHMYPFDQHWLTIRLIDPSHTIDKLVFDSDCNSTGNRLDCADSRVDAAATVPGWELGPGFNVPPPGEYYIEPLDDTYSEYDFAVQIRRPLLASVVKGLLPAVVIVSIAFFNFLVGPDKAMSRLGANTAALSASIFYHITLTSSIPTMGYITLADGFMIVNHVCLGIGVFLSLALVRLSDQKREAAVRRLDRWSAVLLPAAWLVLQGLMYAWITFYQIAA